MNEYNNPQNPMSALDTFKTTWQTAGSDGWGLNDVAPVTKGLFNFGLSSLDNLSQSAAVQKAKEGLINNHTNLPAQNQFNNIWGGVQSLANLWSGYKQFNLAQDIGRAQMDALKKTLEMNTKSYQEGVNRRAEANYNSNPSKQKEYKEKYSL